MKYTKRFMLYAILFITCFLVSNVTASKTFTLGVFTLPAAVFLFPITYILGDLFTEVYGFKSMRTVVWAGFAMNLIAVGYFTLAIALPASGFYTLQDSFSAVLGSSARMLLASSVSFLVGSLLNSTILSKMKVKAEGKGLAARVIVSTIFGEFSDSLVFITLAFVGSMPIESLLVMIVTQASVKVLVEVILYPITKKVIQHTKKVENIDVIDSNISYNPFKA